MPMVSSQNDVWGTRAKTPHWLCVTTQIWLVLLIGWSTTNQRHFSDLGSDTSLGWNFCACSSVSFHGEASGDVGKYWLLSHTINSDNKCHFYGWKLYQWTNFSILKSGTCKITCRFTGSYTFALPNYVPVISVNNAPANISGCYVTKFFKLSICCIIQPNVLVYKRGKIKSMKGTQNLVAQLYGYVYHNFSYIVKYLMRYLHT